MTRPTVRSRGRHAAGKHGPAGEPVQFRIPNHGRQPPSRSPADRWSAWLPRATLFVLISATGLGATFAASVTPGSEHGSTEAASDARRPSPQAPQVGQGPGSPRVSPTSASPSVSIPDAGETSPEARRAPVDVPDGGSGDFAVAPGSSVAVGSGRRTTYRVMVETNLPIDAADAADQIEQTLRDPRGWTSLGDHAFQRVDGESDLTIYLASPATTDELCEPLDTGGELSCRVGPVVALNARRWSVAIPAYDGAIRAYRHYLVNHEVGHAIGYGHRPCPGPGQAAPVMQQQTISLDGCRPWPWPTPPPIG